MCFNKQQGFCFWQARARERRELDAEVQALKHRLQQVESGQLDYGSYDCFRGHVKLLCSTSLIACAFCGWLWLVMEGFLVVGCGL